MELFKKFVSSDLTLYNELAKHASTYNFGKSILRCFHESVSFLTKLDFLKLYFLITIAFYLFILIAIEKRLTLYFAMPQNGQTHFKNLAAFTARFLKCV